MFTDCSGDLLTAPNPEGPVTFTGREQISVGPLGAIAGIVAVGLATDAIDTRLGGLSPEKKIVAGVALIAVAAVAAGVAIATAPVATAVATATYTVAVTAGGIAALAGAKAVIKGNQERASAAVNPKPTAGGGGTPAPGGGGGTPQPTGGTGSGGRPDPMAEQAPESCWIAIGRTSVRRHIVELRPAFGRGSPDLSGGALS